jgi:uracil-DNA glycosylase family 4
MPTSLTALAREIEGCRACPRLVAWRERVAREKVARFRECTYWGRPVPGFGDPSPRIVFVGLAPGAHGANRTGRMFTGDRSGDFLFAALHRAGLANRPTSTSRDDGLVLCGAYIVASIRCVPPGNKPAPDELARCAPFLDRELALLGSNGSGRVVVALGAVAWRAYLGHLERRGVALPRPRPAFAHGALFEAAGASALLGSYHVSQQNTQTRKLTPEMFDAILRKALEKSTIAPRGAAQRGAKPPRSTRRRAR